MKRSEAEKVYKLIEEQTRAEIMARFGRFDNLEFAEYAKVKIEKEDELRKFVFGTSDLLELGTRWNMLNERPYRRRKKKSVYKS